MIKYVPDWYHKKLTCDFCGETRSVKYTMSILINDPATNTLEPRDIYVCNRCALTLSRDMNKMGGPEAECPVCHGTGKKGKCDG